MVKTTATSGTTMLPIVLYGTTRYFADLRLKQFRDIENPHNYEDFHTEEGRKMCRHTGVVNCRECGTSVIVSKVLVNEHLRCVLCGALAEL